MPSSVSSVPLKVVVPGPVALTDNRGGYMEFGFQWCCALVTVSFPKRVLPTFHQRWYLHSPVAKFRIKKQPSRVPLKLILPLLLFVIVRPVSRSCWSMQIDVITSYICVAPWRVNDPPVIFTISFHCHYTWLPTLPALIFKPALLLLLR